MKIADLCKNLERHEIEKWCRAHTQNAYLGDHTALCRVLGSYLMYVDTRDRSLTPHMVMNGFWEMWVTQAIAAYVKPGMRVIDVGANCGYYTLLLADLVGTSGIVHSYEPQIEVFDLLLKSKEVNGLSQVSQWCRAVSDKQGICTLHSNPEFSGSAALTPWRGYRLEEAVGMSPLDHLHRDELVDFVKIDVQGHELQVLEGMRDTISLSPKIAVAMEFSPSEHEDPRAALETILGYGLTVKTIGTDGAVRPITLEAAALADTGDHRMLWLEKGQ